MCVLTRVLPVLLASLLLMSSSASAETGFEDAVRPTLVKYCFDCHAGKDANGDVDLSTTKTVADVQLDLDIWESVVGHLEAGTMPPEDEPQPTDGERAQIVGWFHELVESIDPQPAVFKPRRLSVTEYRNTLRSVLGFDLEVAIIEAEQTLTERSLVVKLLPTDPPGKSGFKNDTHENPLTTVVWDQYSYLVDAALEELFGEARQAELESLSGPVTDEGFTIANAERLILKFVSRAWRRVVSKEVTDGILERLKGRSDPELIASLKVELKAILMSPSFIYRGLLMSGKRGGRRPVDDFELAERLSYFLWADMPDDRLMSLAADRTLSEPSVLNAEIDRMLASPKARSLSDVFATEWLTLNEIEQVSNNPPVMVALKSQPLDFLYYLFTERRPLMEIVDSDVAFINPHTARMYGSDSRQMKRYRKQKGIEVEIVPNQKIRLEQSVERGGILTMPGILAMNRGPIIRGTWILERVLGEHLPEPPANVGQVQPNRRGENLTFRQRFEQHRSNPNCAVCHDKIDPLGFALESFGKGGETLRDAGFTPLGKKKSKDQEPKSDAKIDTSGRLPSGETFDDILGLKRILTTSRREAVVRNIVQRTMSYALCRKLKFHDRPVVEEITQTMIESDGTWHDLFHAVANSISFRETILTEG